MADRSKIEWTDASWNPIRALLPHPDGPKIGWHCEHASDGCRFCYAEAMNKRLGTRLAFKPGVRDRIEIMLDEDMLLKPLKWKRPRMVFVCSMTDLFADFVPDDWIDRMFAVMALCPQHTFQILTKRPARMREYLSTAPDAGSDRACDIYIAAQGIALAQKLNRGIGQWPYDNVWLGVSAERQAEADQRIPDLLATPAAVRFVSLEPLLGPIDLERLHLRVTDARTGKLVDINNPFNAFRGQTWTTLISGPHAGKRFYSGGSSYGRLDWVIVGGESGPEARPMHPDWARSLRDQCTTAGVPLFFKQWGEWAPVSDDEIPVQFGDLCSDFRTLCSNGFVGELSIGSALIHKPHNWPQCFPDGSDGDASCESAVMRRVGKKAAGNTLDGRQWLQWPTAAQRETEVA